MMAWFMTWAVECIVKLFIGLKNNMKTKTRDENVFYFCECSDFEVSVR